LTWGLVLSLKAGNTIEEAASFLVSLKHNRRRPTKG